MATERRIASEVRLSHASSNLKSTATSDPTGVESTAVDEFLYRKCFLRVIQKQVLQAQVTDQQQTFLFSLGRSLKTAATLGFGVAMRPEWSRNKFRGRTHVMV